MRRAGSVVYIHLVWSTWDRHPLLVGETERVIYRTIGQKCQEFGAPMVALGGIEDHIHLLIQLPPTIAIATFVGQVKGASAHLLNHTTPNTGEFFKWQGAYGAVSVSPRHLSLVSAYIRNQKAHHADRTLMPALELPMTAPKNNATHEP